MPSEDLHSAALYQYPDRNVLLRVLRHFNPHFRKGSDQELGDTDGQNENIGDFLKAIKPSQEDLNNLFDTEAEEQENEDDAEKEEETDEI